MNDLCALSPGLPAVLCTSRLLLPSSAVRDLCLWRVGRQLDTPG